MLQRDFYMVCDKCGSIGPSGDTEVRAIEAAKSRGWAIGDNSPDPDECGACQPDRNDQPVFGR